LLLSALAAPAAPSPAAELSPAEIARGGQIGAQLSLFLGIGALTSAFSASVAAAIGGMRRDDMHRLHRAT
jgi:hypothetical protein